MASSFESICTEEKMWLGYTILLLSCVFHSGMARTVATKKRHPSVTNASLDTMSSTNTTSPQIKLMYYDHRHGIQKRDSARLMDECMGYDSSFYRYATSRCDLETGVRAVVVSCRSLLYPSAKQSLSHCLDTEMCWEHGQRAYCISNTQFLAVQNTSPQHPHPHNAFSVLLAETGRGGQIQVARGILTDTSSVKPLQAQTILLLALRQGKMYGRSTCHDCNSTEIDPLPETAKSLWVSVLLKQPEDAGILYLTSFGREEG